MSNKVSVIIPTTEKNYHKAIKCKKAVSDSIYKDVEIIIVNEGKERSAQRNIGMNIATGDFILYLDDDQIVSPELIQECVSLCSDQFYPDCCGYESLYIPEVITTKGFFGYLRNWERQFYTATPIDCVRFIKRENCPLFDETMNGPEDSDHDRRTKGLRTTTKSVLYHEDNVTFLDFLKKKAYYSKSMARFASKYPNDKVLDWKWRCFGVFLENGKWKKFLSRPDLAFLVLCLIFIRGVIYYANK